MTMLEIILLFPGSEECIIAGSLQLHPDVCRVLSHRLPNGMNLPDETIVALSNFNYQAARKKARDRILAS
jgi:hypothetical protein